MALTDIELKALADAGMAALRQGYAATARDKFDEILNAGHGGAEVWMSIAIASKAMGDTARYKEALDQALAVDPGNVRGLIMKGDNIWDEGDHAAAYMFYQLVTQIIPDASGLEPGAAAEIARIKQRMTTHSGGLKTHLLDKLGGTILNRDDTTYRRFIHGFDLLVEDKQRYVQQPRAFYYPELPGVQFYDSAEHDWAERLVQAEAAITTELKALLTEPDMFTPYVHAEGNQPIDRSNPLLDNADWSVIYLIENGVVNEAIAAKLPTVMQALADAPLETIKGRGPTVLISKLAANSSIGQHSGFLNTRLTCHLPLIVPDNCAIRVGNETRTWETGKVLMFNDSINHEAWNKSNEDRYVLIFFIWRPELTDSERSAIAQLLEGIDLYSA